MAEILVNNEVWEPLTAQEKSLVTKTLRESGGIGPHDTIKASADAEKLDSQMIFESVSKRASTACQVACGTAAVGAAAACSLMAPHLAPACLEAAAAGYDQCMKYCDQEPH
ncbi:hypothetical protein SAMN05877838_0873 [Hoeflea halophila]|uniref:Uncharacterized protein n=1 Tax=Hoeflea halophila TaxID=714899 RepID=A0A286HX53_9HYPH|nr:hypothetical protein [Hoeflea halophila]SOE12362.1 hypothetical protein SAMN05877838_0873 [Hoeflea halophila]